MLNTISWVIFVFHDVTMASLRLLLCARPFREFLLALANRTRAESDSLSLCMCLKLCALVRNSLAIYHVGLGSINSASPIIVLLWRYQLDVSMSHITAWFLFSRVRGKVTNKKDYSRPSCSRYFLGCPRRSEKLWVDNWFLCSCDTSF